MAGQGLWPELLIWLTRVLPRILPGLLIGAWTGYITNDAALRMIFKEYGIGRFRFGGVIPKTRAEFTKGLLRLVEEELVRPETVRARLESKELIDAAVRCFYDACGRVLSAAERWDAERAGDGAEAADGEAVAGACDAATAAEGAGEDAEGVCGGAVGAAGSEHASGDEADFAAEAAGHAVAWLFGALAEVLTEDGVPEWSPDPDGVPERSDLDGVPERPDLDGVPERPDRDGFEEAIEALCTRLISELSQNPEFAAARAEFCASYGSVRIRQLIGEDAFVKIGLGLEAALAEFCAIPGRELAEQTRLFARRAAYLVMDARVTERFARAIEGRSIAELLGWADAPAAGIKREGSALGRDGDARERGEGARERDGGTWERGEDAHEREESAHER
ncbi:MAG: hypothetical protein LBU58_04470, partial [Clostridiales bacterium]|nr:hypothetical protein [Clostridiales bacterium]